MTVFKNYLAVAKKYLNFIILYTFIFIGIAIIASSSSSNNVSEYQNVKTKVAIFDNDNSKFTNSFKKYVEANATIVTIKNDQQSMNDALFFRTVDYIMIIPQNFENDFIALQDPKIQTMIVPESSSATYTNTLMNDYLNIARTYIKSGIGLDKLTQFVEESVNISSDVKVIQTNTSTNVSNAVFLFNGATYALLMSIVGVVAMVMISFKDSRIQQRHKVSRLSYQSINRQLILGNCVIGFGVWLIYIIISFILYPSAMFSLSGLLYMLNSAIYVLFILVFGYLVSSFIRSREAINGISNVVGLGGSFISGAFVPQQFLAASVLAIAQFTPMYWYVKANNEISTMTNFSFDNLKPVFTSMLIALGFVVILYIITQIISRVNLKK